MSRHAWTPLLILALIDAAASHAAPNDPADASLVIHADQAKGQVSRHIFGHFAEHLGRCVYDGIWVGADSPIPNTRGVRNDVIEALRNLNIPNLRWPGGCYADQYHWRDGIGPVESRPRTVNISWGNQVEDNSVGTHEFMDLCELIGAEPYIAANVGSGTPKEMMQWLEYMTFAGNSTLADERRANGRDEPWKLPFLGIGNENWGCGGNMTPEYYADLYKQFNTFARSYSGNKFQRIACGPGGWDLHWLEVVVKRSGRHMDGISMHYYTTGGPWHDKAAATGFGEDKWFAVLQEAGKLDELLNRAEKILNEQDPNNKIGIYFDEWGSWYKPDPGTPDWALYQQNTIRDAMLAGLSLHIFFDHHERVRMANIAQIVNVLQAMILTEPADRGGRMLLTPTYHVFEMLKVHQDGTYVPVELEAPPYTHGEASIAAVSAAATRDEAGRVNLSLCNLDPSRPITLSTRIEGVEAESVSGRVLAADELDAHNTFDEPDRVKPQELAGLSLEGGVLSVTLPPRSVSVITLAP